VGGEVWEWHRDREGSVFSARLISNSNLFWKPGFCMSKARVCEYTIHEKLESKRQCYFEVGSSAETKALFLELTIIQKPEKIKSPSSKKSHKKVQQKLEWGIPRAVQEKQRKKTLIWKVLTNPETTTVGLLSGKTPKFVEILAISRWTSKKVLF